jgi:hypothetical protein
LAQAGTHIRRKLLVFPHFKRGAHLARHAGMLSVARRAAALETLFARLVTMSIVAPLGCGGSIAEAGSISDEGAEAGSPLADSDASQDTARDAASDAPLQESRDASALPDAVVRAADAGDAAAWTGACGDQGKHQTSSFCDYYVRQLPCDLAEAGVTSGTYPGNCEQYCGTQNTNCLVMDMNGTLALECGTCPGGRRPHGYSGPTTTTQGGAVGAYFAAAAQLEAVSVDAFQILEEDLCRHGAPRSLLRESRRAARDEVRHATSMRRIAARYGASNPRPPAIAKPRPRSLAQIAAENAAEGCVRETFGALCATYQAGAAQDPRVARVMARIARDETRHAALSWALLAWTDRRLDAHDRRRVRKSMRRAEAELGAELEATPHVDLQRYAGVPPRREALRLLDRLHEALWTDQV